ncbi:Long-chain-fatty-acid--CoA ligase [Caenispirillum salinarum AK4]|uniref:Long-chain-fatty-acid--CoA ligase n=1 Tax=Caenispirillum salinarum AK4 TaxID=1238182 RepID=K9HUV7_9PROT|nr:hypothetical protein [Caenispirillum salinarum]EKV32041.1 Long-chain-fatty-acid--CoA ligase [Caenispirillum salinarum AK4]
MLPAFVDLFADLDDLVKPEAAMLSEAAARLRALQGDRSGADALDKWMAFHAVASATEKVYTGLEKIMDGVAAGVDLTPVPRSGSWHQDLLRRVARPFPEVRPPLLDRDLHAELSGLCSFRHRERNMYGSQLDPHRLAEQADRAVALVPRFEAALQTLHNHLAEASP